MRVQFSGRIPCFRPGCASSILATRSTQSLFFDICCVTLCHESIEKRAFFKMESDGVKLKNTCFSQLSCQHEKNNFTSEAILLTKIKKIQYFQYFQKILCYQNRFTKFLIGNTFFLAFFRCFFSKNRKRTSDIKSEAEKSGI